MADRPKQSSRPAPSPAAPAAPTGDAELSLRSIEAVAGITRQSMETMLTVAHGAVQSFEDIMAELTTFSRDSFERATSAGRAMTAATSPNELLQMQTDYARQQAEAAMAEMTKLSHAMVKTARESLAFSMDSTKLRGGEL